MFLPLFFWLDFIIVATLFGPDIHIDMNMWKISFYAFPLFEMEKNGSVVERESCEHISSPHLLALIIATTDGSCETTTLYFKIATCWT